jgi:hypothetical protein
MSLNRVATFLLPVFNFYSIFRQGINTLSGLLFNRIKMKDKVFILVFFISMFPLNHQAQNTKTITVKTGQSITDVLTFNEIYRYPEFIQGKVFNQDGTLIEARLNYNIVLGEMQFINNQRDTLVIANSRNINYITLLNDTFYVNDGYFELITGNANCMLLVKQYLKLMDVKQEGAYGSSSSTGAVDNYSSISVGNNTGIYKLKAIQDMVFSIRTEYYFGNKSREFLLAREKNAVKLFTEKKDLIKRYIK